MARRRSLAVVLVALAAAAAACGQSDDRDQVRAVAERFFAAVEGGDGAAACEQLSEDARSTLEREEEQPCREAIASLELEGGELGAVEVYLTNAKVDLASGDSAFLSLTADGWRLTAAGCQPEEGEPADVPLECELEV
jgi:hypothetical protein